MLVGKNGSTDEKTKVKKIVVLSLRVRPTKNLTSRVNHAAVEGLAECGLLVCQLTVGLGVAAETWIFCHKLRVKVVVPALAEEKMYYSEKISGRYLLYLKHD